MFELLSLVQLAEVSSSGSADNAAAGAVVGLAILPFILIWLLWIAFVILIFVLVIGGTILWIFMLIDLMQRQFPNKDDKVIWLVILLFTHWIGALVYYYVGRKQGTMPPKMTD
jgi:hypothetical protein